MQYRPYKAFPRFALPVNLPMWLSCAVAALAVIAVSTTSQLANLMLVRTKLHLIGTRELEVEIEAHQITVARVIQAGERRGTDVQDARIFLSPGEATPRTHDRVPAITERPVIDISGVAANARIRLPGHTDQFVSAGKNQPWRRIVVAF